MAARDARAGRDDAGGPYCDRCGRVWAEGDHTECARARTFEPPRFCPTCRRRLKVQVMPAGWVANCVEHGSTMDS